MSIAQDLLTGYRTAETVLAPAAAERFRVNFLRSLAGHLTMTPGGSDAWDFALDFAKGIESDAFWHGAGVVTNGLDFGDVS